MQEHKTYKQAADAAVWGISDRGPLIEWWDRGCVLAACPESFFQLERELAQNESRIPDPDHAANRRYMGFPVQYVGLPVGTFEIRLPTGEAVSRGVVSR